MPIPKTFKKGLQSITTLGNRSNQGTQTHRAYSRISAIEMEKERKQKEKTAMLNQIKAIDERFLELEQEKVYLFQLVLEQPISETIRTSLKNSGKKKAPLKKRIENHKTNANTPQKPLKTNSSHITSTPRSGIQRMLNQSKPKQQKPLPEFKGKGLKIRY